MRCHFIWDEETQQKYLIPGCYGSIDREDLSCCTCKPYNQSLKQFEKVEYDKRVKELQGTIEYLQHELMKSVKIIEELKGIIPKGYA